MDDKEMASIVTQYIRNDSKATGKIKVTRVPDWKSVFVETIGGAGISIVMSECNVDGKAYWAGFSLRSQTIYVSGR
jgi:hypothetical protein